MPRSRSPCFATRMRSRVPASALGAAMGWADWPARLQHLAPGPLVGDREVWLDGGHNPSAARQIATFVKHRFDDGLPLHSSSRASRPRIRRGCSSRSGASWREVHAVPIPDHACFTPSDLVEIAGELGFAADAHDSVEEALAIGSGRCAGADLRVALPCRAVLAANDQVPDCAPAGRFRRAPR